MEYLDRLAEVAHDAWCELMRSDGWRYGDRFSPEHKTHDALVPFNRLGRGDQLAARLVVLASEVMDNLASQIRYTRGTKRDFTVEEMIADLKAVFCVRYRPPHSRAEVDPGDIGLVDGWELGAGGELDAINVRWPKGERTTHACNSEELARWDELEDQP